MSEINFDKGNIDIGLPTPSEVYKQLCGNFSKDQAADIAEYVYQPLREALKHHIIKGIA